MHKITHNACLPRFTYILGVLMRLEKKTMAGVLSRAGRFSSVEPNLKVKEVTHEGKRYIVCVNPEEEKKDRAAREAILSDLEIKLKRGAGQLIGNSGYRRYLKVTKGSVAIDVKKVSDEEKLDGKWVLLTNTDLPANEVARRYKDLWVVERVFRKAKDTLETRPVFHQNAASIMGNVFGSFLALLLMHELKRRVDFACEWDALCEVEVESDGKTYFLRSPLQGVAGKVFRAGGVQIPPSTRTALV